MHTVTRLFALHFDTVSRRYTGEVAVVRPDGREERVEASILGHPGWAHERIARQLIGAARMQAL